MTRSLLIVCAAVLVCWFSRTFAQTPLFVSGRSVTIPGGTGYVGLFDLNRDGHLDLFSGSRRSGSPEVRLGDGRGRFMAAATAQSDFGIKHSAIAFRDLNNDGVLDCVQATRDMTNEFIHVFLGSESGSFVTASSTRLVANRAISFYKPQIWLLDVNEDRKLDIVTQNGRRNTVEIFTGDGRGGFAPAKVVNVEEGYNVYSAAFGDIDHDGHLDMAIAMSPLSTRDQGKVSVFRGNGVGEFAQAGEALAVDSSPILAALADLNSDTWLDIVLGHGEQELLSVLLGGSQGRFGKPTTFSLEPGTSAFTVIVGDVNQDNRSDLIVGSVNSVARPYNSAVVILLGMAAPLRQGPALHFELDPVPTEWQLAILTRMENSTSSRRVLKATLSVSFVVNDAVGGAFTKASALPHEVRLPHPRQHTFRTCVFTGLTT